MRKTKRAAKIVLLCSVAALLATSSSSTHSSFADSANASITAKAASVSSSIVSNGPWATMPEPTSLAHLWLEALTLNSPTYARGHDFTATNNGPTDQYLSLKTNLSSTLFPDNFPRDSVTMNHTNAKVYVGNTEAYSGPASQINSTPVVVKAGSSTTYRIDIQAVYTTALDTAPPAPAWTAIPIMVRMSPSPNSQTSSWDQNKESFLWHAISDFRVREGDTRIVTPVFDDNCMEVNWSMKWNSNPTKSFTFQYSSNSNMSSATTLDLNTAYVSLSKLKLNTTYYYRVLAKSGFKEAWSPIMSFKTGSRDGVPYFDSCPSP